MILLKRLSPPTLQEVVQATIVPHFAFCIAVALALLDKLSRGCQNVSALFSTYTEAWPQRSEAYWCTHTLWYPSGGAARPLGSPDKLHSVPHISAAHAGFRHENVREACIARNQNKPNTFKWHYQQRLFQ
jgi:hypothetical protein